MGACGERGAGKLMLHLRVLQIDTQHILEPNVESVVQVEGAPTEAAWVHA